MEIEHFENQEHEWESNLKVTEGVNGPIQVNPQALERLRRNKQELQPLEWYVNGILKGDRVALSRAITLVESAPSTASGACPTDHRSLFAPFG